MSHKHRIPDSTSGPATIGTSEINLDLFTPSINKCMSKYTSYQNLDGTFTSPKNGKEYKSLKAFISHWCNPGTGGWSKVNRSKSECKFCDKEYGISNVKKHEQHCYLNPINLAECNFCKKPIKNYTTSKGTCSKSCSNSFFKVGKNNGNFKGTSYQYLCFANHEKKCVVCGENKIVAVHHYNEIHTDNRPENLVPLCPTHHQYMHSRFSIEIKHIVDDYINKFKLGLA